MDSQSPSARLQGRTVILRAPASAAFKLDALEVIQRRALGLLGCEGCHSGFDLRWDFHEVIQTPEIPALDGHVSMIVR